MGCISLLNAFRYLNQHPYSKEFGKRVALKGKPRRNMLSIPHNDPKFDYMVSQLGHPGASQEPVELRVVLPQFICRNLTSLGRNDLPPTVAIQQAREMYPWFDTLIRVLQTEAS